ncbi:alkaline phosphatase [Pseudonocardia kunmingensis]|uniref:Alkaline phosphatase n=1 Tax=Pseudonocardia kunmingensis TaxID=630975 RepID=A0A543DWK4_9PSEU|nr:alkaline phosphatase [Pseudonocardia kunmingensis]TQM13704.1 alkaline phosphatase [Pseudonocardia kunmingensis]
MAPPSARTRATRALALAVAVVLPAACSTAPSGAPEAGAREEVARNVILLLGDGLGQPQREFLRMAVAGPNGELAMDRLDVTGSVDTSPAADDQVTDSAAAATAFATGVRTTNGAVGVDVDGEPLTTALELARDAGKATGLVTTSQVTDASPAAFAAHVGDRDLQSEIAEQYLEDARVDVVLGGGRDHWLPEGSQRGAEDDERDDEDGADEDGTDEDGRSRGDLIARATQLGYTHVSDAAGLAAADDERLLGLFADQEMFEKGGEGEGRYAPAVPLADMTQAALRALERREAGFFLLVEEEGIDEMAHHNNAAQVLEAGRALEGAVETALQFQAGHPDTLVVVAGDHETGGMEVTATAPGAPPAGEDGPFPAADSDRQLWVDWSTADHTDAPTPITAGGPGAEAFEGEIQNTQVFTGVMESMSLAN